MCKNDFHVNLKLQLRLSGRKLNKLISLNLFFLFFKWLPFSFFYIYIRSGLCHPGDCRSPEHLLHCCAGLGHILSLQLLHLGSSLGVLQQHMEHRWGDRWDNKTIFHYRRQGQLFLNLDSFSVDSCCILCCILCILRSWGGEVEFPVGNATTTTKSPEV